LPGFLQGNLAGADGPLYVLAHARRQLVGGSFKRWMGMMGKSCLIAQLSGIDWKIEKLQK